MKEIQIHPLVIPVIPAKAGIQLIENYPAKRDNMAVLSASLNVLLLNSRLPRIKSEDDSGNDEANAQSRLNPLSSRRSLPSNGVVVGEDDVAHGALL